MRRVLARSDDVALGVARLATTLGQCALVALGVHLAADNLDDRLLALLVRAQEALPEVLRPGGELPLPSLAAGAALLVEAAATLLLWDGFVLSPRAPVLSWGAFRRAACVRALVLPAALAGVLAAGAWSLAMALEDLLPAGPLSPWSAGLVGLAALLRFGGPAWVRAVASLEPPRRWSVGLPSALVLAPVGALAWIHGLPLWGWLP